MRWWLTQLSQIHISPVFILELVSSFETDLFKISYILKWVNSWCSCLSDAQNEAYSVPMEHYDRCAIPYDLVVNLALRQQWRGEYLPGENKFLATTYKISNKTYELLHCDRSVGLQKLQNFQTCGLVPLHDWDPFSGAWHVHSTVTRNVISSV
jgi:hypothetical protein